MADECLDLDDCELTMEDREQLFDPPMPAEDDLEYAFQIKTFAAK